MSGCGMSVSGKAIRAVTILRLSCAAFALLAAALCLPGAAQAQSDSGYYLSLEAGMNLPTDSNAQIVGASGGV